jgi:hypothetical protein
MKTLKTKFEELIHMTWDQFVELEEDKNSSVDDTVLCSLIRTCADTDDIAAIKLAFDRVDGLQEVPIDIKVPKFYIRYINAKEIEAGEKQLEASEQSEVKEKSSYDPASAKLRETLKQMRDMPRDAIRVVGLYKKRIDKGIKVEHAPMVKSVIVANLLKNVTKGRFKAVELVFDQIDGKLTRTISLLGGDDVYVDDVNVLVAPAHSLIDEKGFYYAEDKVMTAAWIRGFANSQKGLESLVEGLEDD